MPESTCLHIQDRESGPIRVVELHWISVRIGRAAFCEIHLPDDRLAEEVCRLTRKGRTWSLIPSSGHASILFEGRPLAGPCPLPFDVPFRLGPYCLTLRHDVAAEPDWELYPASEPPAPIELPRASEAGKAEAGVTAPTDSSKSAGRPGSDPDRWRARWKAAEAHLKARAARLDTGGQRVSYSTPPEAPRDTERPLYRPPSVSPPTVDRPTRPVPTPSAPRIEPVWKAPRADFAPATPRVEPELRPTPPPAAYRDEPRATPSSDPPASSPQASDFTEKPFQQPDSTVAGQVQPTEVEAGDALVDAHPTRAPFEPWEAESDASPSEYVVPAFLLEAEKFDVAETDVFEAPPLGSESSHSAETDPDPDVIRSPRQSAAARPSSRTRSGDGEGVRTGRGPTSGAGPARPMDRGPRRRKPPRRSRIDAVASESIDHERGPASNEAELPSVRDILATHRNSPGPRPAVERSRRGGLAVPTVPQEPGQWVLPGWLALPPVGVVALAIGVISCVLSWWWTLDASNSSVVTQRLLTADGSARRRRLPENLERPGGRWIKTTAQHLAHWAIYTAGVEQDERHSATEAPSILTQALEVSPLNPTARLAMSQLEGTGGDGSGRIRGLGLSRDSVSLAWSARRLMDSGKRDAALRLYHRALSSAADGGLSRSVTPRFAEDPGLRRYYYLLPSEDAVHDIVAELAARDGLEFRGWSRALPHNPTVLLATARILRERAPTEADALLDRILGDDWGATRDGPADPRLLAARAEALTLRSRWQDAAEQYRQAIELVDNDLIRRSWWFNLADIAQRLNDEGQRQAALRAALAVNNSDDISRRVSLLQKSGDTRVKPRAGYGTARAN